MVRILLRRVISFLQSQVSAGVDHAHRLGRRSYSLGNEILRTIEAVDRDILSTLSIIIFLIGTAVVTVKSIVSLENIYSILVEGEPLLRIGFGRDIDDTILKPFPNPVQSFSGIAFSIVLGQILHRLNQEVLSFWKPAAVGLMSVYSILLGASYFQLAVVQWTILSQFLLVLLFGLTLVTMASVSIVRNGISDGEVR